MGRHRIYTEEEAAAHREASLAKYNASDKRAAVLARYNAGHVQANAGRKAAWRENNPQYQSSYHSDKVNKARILVNAAKVRAKKKGVPFNITWRDIDIPDVCPVLGIPIVLGLGRGYFAPDAPSIDRLVPAAGYVKGNVRVISMRANLIKRDGSLAELEAIVAYLKRELQ